VVQGERSIWVPHLLQEVPQVEKGIEVFGLESQGRFEAGTRQRQVSLLVEDQADVGVSVRVLWPETKRNPQCGGCLVKPAQATQGHAVVVVVCGLVGVQGNGLGDHLDSLFILSALVRQNAEQVKRTGVLRVLCDDLPVKRFRLDVATVLVQSDGGGEYL